MSVAPTHLVKKSSPLIARQVNLEKWIGQHSRIPFLDIVMESYTDDYGDLWGIFAYPGAVRKRGIGKSVLSIKLLLAVYRDWGRAKRFIFYSPEEFIRVFERLVDNNERAPLAVWDDAGAWLFRGRFKNRFVMAVAEHLEVIRTHLTTMMFTATTVGKLAKAIRESLSFVTLVSVFGVRVDEKGRRWKRSTARLYIAQEDYEWMFHRRKMPEPLMVWNFTVRLPDPIYQDYKQLRDRYVVLGLRKLKAELRELADKAAEELVEVAEKAEPGRRPDPIMDPEEVLENIDLEDLREAWGY